MWFFDPKFFFNFLFYTLQQSLGNRISKFCSRKKVIVYKYNPCKLRKKFLWSNNHKSSKGHFELLWFFDSQVLFFLRDFLVLSHNFFLRNEFGKSVSERLLQWDRTIIPATSKYLRVNKITKVQRDTLNFCDFLIPKTWNFQGLFILHITFFWERIWKICFQEIVATGYNYHPCKFQVFATNNTKNQGHFELLWFFDSKFFFLNFLFYT